MEFLLGCLLVFFFQFSFRFCADEERGGNPTVTIGSARGKRLSTFFVFSFFLLFFRERRRLAGTSYGGAVCRVSSGRFDPWGAGVLPHWLLKGTPHPPIMDCWLSLRCSSLHNAPPSWKTSPLNRLRVRLLDSPSVDIYGQRHESASD